jgi:hypothetical protein
MILSTAPCVDAITLYDQQHFLTYARLLSAEKHGTSWRVAASVILQCDVTVAPEIAHACYESHLARARWIITDGLLHICGDGVSDHQDTRH